MPNSNVYNFSAIKLDENAENAVKLAAKAKQGDTAAFGQIYELYFQKIYKFIYYRVGHKHTAEDLTEEVFLKAHLKIASLSQARLLEAWLYQIARNLVTDYYRQKKQTVDLAEVENTLEYETNLVDLVNLHYQQAILLKLLKELGADQQQVLKMKFLEDLDTAEIAEILGKSESNIRVLQHRALTKLITLRKKLEEEDE